MNRFRITIRDGKLVDIAEITIFSTDFNEAEEISDDILKKIDPTAYVDAIDELA
jgi:hypothetical protein